MRLYLVVDKQVNANQKKILNALMQFIYRLIYVCFHYYSLMFLFVPKHIIFTVHIC